MSDDNQTIEDRTKLLRARLRIVSLLLVDVAVLLVMGMGGMPWNHWVLLIVTMLLTLAVWVTKGLSDGGWAGASLMTWMLNMFCMTAMHMDAGASLTTLLAGVMYGSIWTAFLLVPLAIVSTVVREVT